MAAWPTHRRKKKDQRRRRRSWLKRAARERKLATARASLCSLLVTGCLVHVPDLGAHVHGCRSKDCDRRIHRKRAHHWLHAHRPWVYAWRHLSAFERSWARCIASYETRGIPWPQKARTATGNGYYGSTQWLPSTWHMAGGSGLPTEHSLHEQLVRTVRWAHEAGSSQWSTSRMCGAV